MRNITKRFDAVVALDGASLRVKPGEILALLGSNGSGKSTMIKSLSGLVRPNSGEILFDGRPVAIHSSQDAQRLGVAAALQDLSLAPTMSVVDNIVLGHEPAAKFGMTSQKAAARQVRALLDKLHINCDLNAYVQTLVPSAQSLIEVAKAIYLKPRLLLLDEVTASLHYDEAPVLFSVLRELKANGTAVIFVTHRIDEVFELCDSVNIMRGGQTVMACKTGDLTVNDIIFHMTGRKPDTDSTAKETPAAHTGETILEVNKMEIFPKVKDISFRAERGEIIGIAGLEGQGQPEFIRALLGELPIDGGEVVYKGKKVSYRSPAEAVRDGVGFISGDRNREAIFPIRPVEENVYAGQATRNRLFRYVTAKEIRRFAENAIEKYSIVAGALKSPASSLSGGNQQKLAVARWIAINPDLLLLDDPTKGVDIHSRREIHQILRSCAAEARMTVVYASSENEELLEIADTIYVFYEGRVSGVLRGPEKAPERLVAAQMGLVDGKAAERGLAK